MNRLPYFIESVLASIVATSICSFVAHLLGLAKKASFKILLIASIVFFALFVIIFVVIFEKINNPDSNGSEESIAFDLDELIEDYPQNDWTLYSASVAEKNSAIAVSSPFKSESEDAILEELKQEILRNPVLGDMVAQGLSHVYVAGQPMTVTNPWIVDFLGKTETSSVGCDIWLEHRNENLSTFYVTEEYHEYAANICRLLDSMEIVGIDSVMGDNWKLGPEMGNNHGRTFRVGSVAIEKPIKAFLLEIGDSKTETTFFTIGFSLDDKSIIILPQDDD